MRNVSECLYSLCAWLVLLSCAFTILDSSANERHHQQSKAAADHPPAWSVDSYWQRGALLVYYVDSCWGGWWRWALLSPDGVAPSWMVSVSASVNLTLHHKVQKFSSGTGSPGWSRKKGHKTVVVRGYLSALARPHFLWHDSTMYLILLTLSVWH